MSGAGKVGCYPVSDNSRVHHAMADGAAGGRVGPGGTSSDPSGTSHSSVDPINGRRGVVSFVRRSPRMNESQRQALASHSSEYLVEVPHDRLSTSVRHGATMSWPQVFGRQAPLVAEIGSGVGDSLVAMAGARPSDNVIAFEVYLTAVASTMGKLARADVHNVRLVVADGGEGLRELVRPGELSELWTFFPDPWPKKRHHKRRLVQPGFAALVADRLAPGGLWRLATDWADYADQMREVLDAEPGLTNVYSDRPGGWAPRPDRPFTRFEKRGLDAGREVRDLAYRRVHPEGDGENG
ncbi:tRNA (guanine-N(7)-)-methyltransferase [Propionibacterium freudenreichii]|nr:tRNA (guanine-N(7)-)-methyltransferase [Propionibacterium freudenreichii]